MLFEQGQHGPIDFLCVDVQHTSEVFFGALSFSVYPAGTTVQLLLNNNLIDPIRSESEFRDGGAEYRHDRYLHCGRHVNRSAVIGEDHLAE